MPADDQYYYDLAYARAQQKEQAEMQDTANRIVRPPSGTLYFFLYVLAGTGDLVDWLVFTGIGAIIS
ncbi:MAG: hypothetical protein HYT65_02475, partial [Candidatus Yanofskybacteria bacterium]|nr:hypothetical protein [Candidatus Yanofskybacteria bacterium]